MLDFIRGKHSWGRFYRLLSQLDGDSRFVKAQLDDPELAKLIADRYDPNVESKATPPALRDWSLPLTMQSLIYNRLGEIAALLADLPVAVKTRHKPPAPFPQPETAVDKAKRAKKMMVEQASDDKLFGAIAKAQQRYREMTDDQRAEYKMMGSLTHEEQAEYRDLPAEERAARLDAWRNR